jgi:hypothetical protein
MTAEDWSSKQRYEYVETMCQGAIRDHSPPVVAKEQQVRLKACANGSLSVDGYETALQALAENHRIARGDGWVCWPVDRGMLIEAIEYVGESAFVASANQLLQSGVLDGG